MAVVWAAALVPGAVPCPHLLTSPSGLSPSASGAEGAVYVRNAEGQTQALCVLCIETLRALVEERADPPTVTREMQTLGYGRKAIRQFLKDLKAA